MMMMMVMRMLVMMKSNQRQFKWFLKFQLIRQSSYGRSKAKFYILRGYHAAPELDLQSRPISITIFVVL